MKEILIPDELYTKLLIESEKRKIAIEKLTADVIKYYYINQSHLDILIETEMKIRQCNKCKDKDNCKIKEEHIKDTMYFGCNSYKEK